jgi:hypothetical protein
MRTHRIVTGVVALLAVVLSSGVAAAAGKDHPIVVFETGMYEQWDSIVGNGFATQLGGFSDFGSIGFGRFWLDNMSWYATGSSVLTDQQGNTLSVDFLYFVNLDQAYQTENDIGWATGRVTVTGGTKKFQGATGHFDMTYDLWYLSGTISGLGYQGYGTGVLHY